MSSHPDPGNRSQYIQQEAAKLTIAARPDPRAFTATKSRFASLPPAKFDVRQDARRRRRRTRPASVGTVGQPVPRPADAVPHGRAAGSCSR